MSLKNNIVANLNLWKMARAADSARVLMASESESPGARAAWGSDEQPSLT